MSRRALLFFCFFTFSLFIAEARLSMGQELENFDKQFCDGAATRAKVIEPPNAYYKEGMIDENELHDILLNHCKWLEALNNTNRTIEVAVKLGTLADFRADLNERDLGGWNLNLVNLAGAGMSKVNLSGALIQHANLRQANLAGAVLKEADLLYADLRGANLSSVDLSGAHLLQTKLKNTVITEAIISGSYYEPWVGDPASLTLVSKQDFTTLKFGFSPHGLFAVREVLKAAGLRHQERQVTFAIEKVRRELLIDEGGSWNKAVGWSKYLLFEFTSNYGLTPERPLQFALAFFLICSLFYALAVWVYPRMGEIRLVIRPELPWEDMQPSDRIMDKERRWWVPFYFGLHSAFRIGWRDLNLGSWLTNTQTSEFHLRSRGWVRVVAGFQSIVSVYLVALSILSYFGNPFE